jgi:hypothetical protein
MLSSTLHPCSGRLGLPRGESTLEKSQRLRGWGHDSAFALFHLNGNIRSGYQKVSVWIDCMREWGNKVVRARVDATSECPFKFPLKSCAFLSTVFVESKQIWGNQFSGVYSVSLLLSLESIHALAIDKSPSFSGSMERSASFLPCLSLSMASHKVYFTMS